MMRRMTFRRALLSSLALFVLVALVDSGCSSGPTGPGLPGARTFRMGFSGIPPRPDFATAVATINLWTQRADGAIFHVAPPWDSLLAGVSPDSLILKNEYGLAQYYRSKNLDIVVTLDATDGLNRTQEAPELIAAGRSLGEPAVRQLYRDYAVAIDTLLKPSRMGFAAETNLIRAAAPTAVYNAVIQAANVAAADVRARDPLVRRYVSVQVEVAWGRLTSSGPLTYAGVAQDLLDFPFAQDIGLSSYPYLGGFSEPEQVPLDYYSAVHDEVARPVLMVEGGWTSASVGSVTSSPQKQARWIAREAALLGRAQAVGWYQLTFADLALSAFPPQPPGSILPLFASLGLVDTTLAPKPALGVWDNVFRRPLQ